MAGRLGRVLVGGTDCGAGFAVGPRLVVTANHVVRGRNDQPVVYVPTGGEAVGVERVQPDIRHDAAILWLVSAVREFLPASAVVQGAKWQVQSPPPGTNDPELHGTVSTARMTIEKAEGQRVDVVQLEVEEHLGDFGGYSGSAVLDSLGRAVLALLVEQKPLRTAVALGERQMASNVLYAVPIGDVITAFELPVRTSRPLRFDVGLLPPGMVTRPGLVDEAVGRVIRAEGRGTGAGLVILRGLGGGGKTVLARQIADDPRIWAEFADGIIMLRAGQDATADGVARQLQEALGCRDRALGDVLAGQRLLLTVDDVWDPELLVMLRANLPGTTTVLATTRGVSAPGTVSVDVGAVSRDEAIQILARGTPRSFELDQALGVLAETLFRWALLLNLAAGEIHRDDELDWGFDDGYNRQPRATEPDVAISRAQTLRREFPNDPTMLDDLGRAPEAAAPRSVDVLVRRSLEWLGPERQARFEHLAVYPLGAAITQPMLEDLWRTSPNGTRKEIKLLVRAGLAQPVRRDRLTIELHDLITAWLYYACGRPGEVRHQAVHQRLAGLCLLADSSPGKLTRDRAEWLVYHLVAAGAWDRLMALPTLRWRSAFLIATGSDAAFLAGLDQYGHAAVVREPPDAVYHAVRAWLFAAHVRALIGRLPIPVLVAMALVGDPIAGITQACQHPEAGKAVPAVLAAVADRLDVRLLIDQVVAVAGTIPVDRERSEALAAIAQRLGAADPLDPALIDQALTVAQTIPVDRERSRALVGIVQRLAAADAPDPALIDKALTVARTIPVGEQRHQALAAIAERLAAADPPDPALIDKALTVARTIPVGEQRHQALAAIAPRLAAADPPDPALIDKALAMARTLPAGWPRNGALAAIAERLAAADPPDPALIDRVLAMARTFPAGWRRDGALAAIAERLAAADPPDPALIDKALTVAQTIHDGYRGGRALAAIAQKLAIIDPARSAALIDQAVALAGTISDRRKRGEALAAIAERLAAADPPDPALIDKALTIVQAVPESWQRHQARAAIAQRLAAADPPDPALIDKALTVAQTIPDVWRRGEVLAAIAQRLAAAAPRDLALIDKVLAAAQTMPNSSGRSEARAAIAQRLAAADPPDPALIDRALGVAGTIWRGQQRSEALAAIAQALALIDPARSTALIDQAVTLAGTVPDSWGRSGALASIAERLAAADPPDPAPIDRALAVARAIPDDQERGKALAAIAQRLAVIDPVRSAALIDQAVALAGTVPDERQRNEMLGAIAQRLAAADPPNPALIDKALTVARSIPSDRWPYSKVLATIAERLAAADPPNPALIDKALAVARTISGGWQHGEALAAIAQRVAVIDPVRSTALIDQAVALAVPRTWEALAAIAQRVAAIDPARSAALIDEALAVTGTIRVGWNRREALAAIAQRVAAIDPARRPALIDKAVALAGTIPDTHPRSEALAAIAQGLAVIDPVRSAALIDQALTVAGQDGEVLAAIAKRLAGADPPNPALIDKALSVAGTIPGDWRRGETLAAIAQRLAAADPPDPALIDKALTVAGTILDRLWGGEAPSQVYALTTSSMLDELSRWRLRSLGALTNLLAAFLRNCHDTMTTQNIGIAVLKVVVEFSPEA